MGRHNLGYGASLWNLGNILGLGRLASHEADDCLAWVGLTDPRSSGDGFWPGHGRTELVPPLTGRRSLHRGPWRRFYRGVR